VRGGDRFATGLVQDLRARARFTRLWAQHDVAVRRSDRKRIIHPNKAARKKAQLAKAVKKLNQQS
jgi:ribosomal protein S20